MEVPCTQTFIIYFIFIFILFIINLPDKIYILSKVNLLNNYFKKAFKVLRFSGVSVQSQKNIHQLVHKFLNRQQIACDFPSVDM